MWSHVAATVLPSYVANTALLLLGVGAGVLVLGIATAWLVSMCRFPGSRILEWALLLPMAMPAYLMAYTYTDLLDVTGPLQTALRAATGWTVRSYWFPPIRSLGGAIAVMTLVFFPYVYLVARAAFLDQSVCVLEAGRTLGRGPWRSFATIALPLARPAIVAGLTLALMEAVADFGTVEYFAVDTFTTGIYRSWFGMDSRLTAAQLAAGLLIVVLALKSLELVARGGARYFHTTSRYRPLIPHPLTPLPAALAALVCVLPILLGFVVPAGALVRLTLMRGDQLAGTLFPRLAANTLILAAIAGLLAVAIGALVASSLRLAPGWSTRAAASLATLGYAVPGSVIAVGVLASAGFADNTLDGWMRATRGVSTGLVFSGTIAALVFAYLVRFLAVSFQTIEAGLAKVRPSMEDAVRTLGRSPLGALRTIHVPLVRGSLLTAGLLVFVEVMKELPATLVVRPFNFDTLAVRVYRLAADERLAGAATPALAIVATGLLPVIILSVAIARSRPGSGSDSAIDSVTEADQPGPNSGEAIGSATNGGSGSARDAQPAALAVRGVTHRYGARSVLEGIDLSAHAGEVVCVLGPSGCGKTTLLRLVAGLEPLQAGHIDIAGRTVAEPRRAQPPEARSVGMVFQDLALFPHLRVLENVTFGLRRGPRKDRRQRGLDLLKRVELQHRATSYPHTLSGGEQQRVAVARAVAPRPTVVLLDEPFNTLDASLRSRVRGDLLALLRDEGAAVLLVTHDQDEALTSADRVAVMRAGRIEQIDSPGALYNRPATRFAAQFVGAGTMVPATLSSESLETPLGVIPRTALPATSDAWPAGEVELLVRPEEVEIEPRSDGNAIVTRRLARGPFVEYDLRLLPRVGADPASGEVVRARATVWLPEGTPVQVRLTLRHLVAFSGERAVLRVCLLPSCSCPDGAHLAG